MSAKAAVVRPSEGWVATIHGGGDRAVAERSLREACARMRGDGIPVTALDVQDQHPGPRGPRVVRRPR